MGLRLKSLHILRSGSIICHVSKLMLYGHCVIVDIKIGFNMLG